MVLLVRALAAAGQAPDALAAARAYRRRLAEETGLDAGPALGELERAVAAGATRTVPTRPAAPLIGRELDLAQVRDLLARERLVTLVGPGGVGKTRLARELAGEAVLLLAPVTDPAAVPRALAAALRLQVVRGDVLTACVGHLAARPQLLVVDNCEHLVDAARDVVGVLLDGCPDLTVLATSREPLGLAVEAAYRLPPLSLDGAGPPHEAPAVAVFLDRAARVRPGFAPDADDLALVADVVRRLDGMPLAIELAAGRLSGFSLRELHARLDRALDLLSGGRPSADARHRTLRDTVEWSYALLGRDEQRLFRHLSVFADGVDLATAEEVAADLDLGSDPGAALARLVDASMIDAIFESVPDPVRAAAPHEVRGGRVVTGSITARATGCWRRCGRSATTGSSRTARTTRPRDASCAGRRPSSSASTRRRRPTTSPRPTSRCGASWPPCARRGGWPASAATSTPPRPWPWGSTRCRPGAT